MPLQFFQLNSMASEVTSKTTWFESVHCLQKTLNYIQLTYFSFQNVQSRLLYFKFSKSFNESRLSQLHSISGSIYFKSSALRNMEGVHERVYVLYGPLVSPLII